MITLAMDWIEIAAKRQKKAEETASRERDRAMSDLNTLRERREEHFQRIERLLRSAVEKTNKTFNSHISVVDVDLQGGSFVIRKQDNPGVRIDVNLSADGRLLTVDHLRTRDSISMGNGTAFTVRLVLDDKVEVQLKDEHDDLLDGDELCKRVLSPAYRALQVPLEDD